ncbi:MAG: TrkH family potassium uptake protein [bacterium]
MRQSKHLRTRYRTILSYTGLVLLLCSALMLLPLLALLAWPEESRHVWGFIIPALTLGGLGVGLWRLFRPDRDIALTVQEGGAIVLLTWTTVCLFSAWPFSAVEGLGFTQSVFESVSGWTTTGLSVVDVQHASRMILLWRSIMQLAGGAGLAIIMLSAIAGPTGPGLSSAEGRQQLVPHVRHSARLVMVIYSGYVIVGILAYALAGMGWFDAINHAFAAVSTGGFSTKVDSIGHWNSPTIEAVTMPLMFLGNLNFVTAWLLLRGKFRSAGRNGEIRLFALLVPVCALALFLFTCAGLYPSIGHRTRVALFQTMTALTTTGYSTVSFANWNGFGWLLLIGLMIIGGGTCSTAGGIKQYRVYILWKSLVWHLRSFLLPRTAVAEHPVYQGERKVFIQDSHIRRIGTFLFLYLLGLVLGTAVIAAHGYDLRDSLFEYASALGTVGLSVGVTSVSAPPAILWAETAGMFLGRLEFIVILVSIAKLFRDGVAMFTPRNAA